MNTLCQIEQNICFDKMLLIFLCAIVILGEFYILKVKPSTSVQLSVYLMILGSIVAAYNDLAFNLRG